MTPRLVRPEDAAAVLRRRLSRSWAERICAEVQDQEQVPITIALRPGVSSGAQVERLGYGPWSEWVQAWTQWSEQVGVAGPGDGSTAESVVSGVHLESRRISVRRVVSVRPLRLRVDTLRAGEDLLRRMGAASNDLDLGRRRRIAVGLRAAGGRLSPGVLTSVCRLGDQDVDALTSAIAWLAEHPALDEWTARQLPVRGTHSKWVESHRSLLTRITGRDLEAEIRPRLAVVHLTYLDPDYVATGGRRHDAWTSGDRHSLAYRPRIVLIVENRDCRLWFPQMPGAVVVEGGGRAAAALLGGIEWITDAEHVVYWGDIDADGFAILSALRAELTSHGVRLASMLMDEATRSRYAELGVSHDRHGAPLQPSSTALAHLTAEEASCYAAIATLGQVEVRRIEQERIDLSEALEALRTLTRDEA